MFTFPSNDSYEYETNISGGPAGFAGPVHFTGPEFIPPFQEAFTFFTWDLGSSLADTFRLTVGLSPGASDVWDSLVFTNRQSWGFNNLPATTLYVTLYFKFGNRAEWQTIDKVFYREADRSLPNIDGLWDDEKPWSDTSYWYD